jgi:hypothetical protein
MFGKDVEPYSRSFAAVGSMLRERRVNAGRGGPNLDIEYETVLAGDDARTGAVMLRISAIWRNDS